MAKKQLLQVGTELGVGLETIHEYLVSQGFEIAYKPNAKVTEEMYDVLLEHFQADIAIKNKAEQIAIHNKPVLNKGETKHEVKEVVEAPKEEEKGKTETTPHEYTISVPEPDDVDIPIEVQPKELKVVGKIDLDQFRKKPATEHKREETVKPTKENKAEVTPVEDDADSTTSGSRADDEPMPENPVKEGTESTEDEMYRASAPTLKGLKIMGKIDTSKISKQPKKAPETKPTEKKPDNTQTGNQQDKKKRARTKFPVRVNDNASRGQVSRGDNKFGKPKRDGTPTDPVREVTKKEIDDKIKSTLARLNVGGKNKRQKIRRDNRERTREKEELAMHNESLQDTKLQVTEFISVSELASLMNLAPIDVISTCMSLGVMVSINQRLDAEIIELVASEYGFEIEFISAEDQLSDDEVEVDDDTANNVPRAPIITVMGHVDHGKTSLLDYIRNANVVSGEAGGITQHIGAYEVDVKGKKIVFLDTPGHEAFTAMRARGAKITDVAVIIIAADDSIMPQTREAISHAQAASVPIVFAINKIDKPGADPEKIKNELSQMNLLVEEWGGSIQSQDISSKTGQNIDLLLEKILLEAEMLDLKANPDRLATGTVVEASLDKGRGYVTKILVQNGTLSVSDFIVAGGFSGRVKAMFNERGKKLKSVGPSSPVLVLGLSGAPQAGEKFKEYANESEGRQVAVRRAQINREQTDRATKRISLDEIGRRLALGTFKELNLIIKGDVDGSIEALADSLIKLSIETVQVNVIHKAVGQIIESDVLLASASDAIVIGFQVRPSLGARKLAEREGVEIKTYSIIYEAINEIKAAIEGMLEPTQEENIIGQVTAREIYKISKIGTVVGGYVDEGKINRNSYIRIVRDGIVIFPTKEGAHGEISSLKRFKEDTREVKAGLECGLTIKNFNDLKVGDTIEVYEINEVKQTLS
jgi:translation initiation factor IF-2